MVELDSQSSGSLLLTMAREAIPPLCTHVLHSFSPHGLKGMAYGGAEAGGSRDKQGHLHLLLRPPDERFGRSSSCLLCCSTPATCPQTQPGVSGGEQDLACLRPLVQGQALCSVTRWQRLWWPQSYLSTASQHSGVALFSDAHTKQPRPPSHTVHSPAIYPRFHVGGLEGFKKNPVLSVPLNQNSVITDVHGNLSHCGLCLCLLVCFSP